MLPQVNHLSAMAPLKVRPASSPSVKSTTLSILIPVYNEEEFIYPVLDRVLCATLPRGMNRELIIVDDCSSDDSWAVLKSYCREHPKAPIRIFRQARNQGKGAAIRMALKHARGEFSIIQDSDLEYDPADYEKIVSLLLDGQADAVFGSRFATGGHRRVLYFWHSIANWILTTLCNMAADLNLTDMETCYKAFRTSLVQGIPIRSKRFGIEPELTIKLAKRQARICEVPIVYNGRTYDEGKKIGARDAVAALWTILRCWLSSDLYDEDGRDILDALTDARRFNRWMADTISDYVGSDVLEIGAGMGNITRHLACRRRRYIASDIDVEHLARLRARLQHRPNLSTATCDLTESGDFAPFAERMDTVVCLNVLEHIENDLAGLKNIRSVLKPGGRAIVLVPQGPENYGTLDEALGQYRRYSRDELAAKMNAVGFRMEGLLDFNHATYPGWFLNGRVLKRRYFSRFQLAIFDRLVPVFRVIDRYLPWPATSIIAIGVRE
jgi:glycosyltransferase involved in cell wall biosynthesis